MLSAFDKYQLVLILKVSKLLLAQF